MKTTATCPECLEKLKELQKICGSCGYTVELVPAEELIERYLKRPSPGGLFWTQAYALGTRQYLWFLVSLIPIAGFVALGAMFLFGRRLSWKSGEWDSFAEFKKRQQLMDGLAYAWLGLLIAVFLYMRYVGQA
ncbi:hypothetical protein COV06_03130 [Candidatus Uhrbacteria bacterium CG10_big_fil_rev_8_21_14_0_10_50_16]|uniref:Uncharacterized protein n=1 Tax=Candidatus Uhrbacteria bacterium CG10_big_fil_rev_8_21_14_0_10_50_16 TaxID=1975039 RepID=A0A2H0RLW9_9BACT|nr:MAG: hypothetical protein COV06_03130 [Candidatus Uhrbacteria bacterium CG10_big_fil_rev_8_21_14_0_10_50_16]